jgi:hypothetical protein
MGRYWPESVLTLPWDVKIWLLAVIGIGLVAVIVGLLLGDRLRTWWITNLLRNYLDAKRRLQRERRRE